MKKEQFNLMTFFEGYVRNYRRLNFYQIHNGSMYTRREIEYFANLGEMLGYHVFVEDSKPNKSGKSRPMDLAWWKWDERIDPENFIGLVLHLERENVFGKDTDTIEKLFAEVNEEYQPQYVIGIQNLKDESRIGHLNNLVRKKNKTQGSDVLMIYRFVDRGNDYDRVWAYYFESDKFIEERRAISTVDKSNYWYMAFEEEYRG